ncbi:MAG: DUF3027 domain-containing protein [Streptosporangiales bacterium]
MAARLVLDATCAAAVEAARAAARDAAVSPDSVGEHLEVCAEGDRVATHAFACLDLAYRGWRWSITVARASRARQVTVSEVTLLPGPDAVVAPAWVPWEERVRPGDLGPGDLLPTAPDDLRLQPGYTDASPDADPLTWWEPGLGRTRVLSRRGRGEAAERWYDGEPGPTAAIARTAPAACATCGFLLPLAGSVGQLFGVCANEFVPDDGRVVSLDHGCGGHSEVVTEATDSGETQLEPTIDEIGFDVLDVGRTAAAASQTDDLVEESLGHS